MIELFDHQKSGIEFLKKKGKAILADEMGLGKTRQAIVASGEAGPFQHGALRTVGTLIVCPASLKINWMREIRMVYPNDSIEILSSTEEPENRSAAWYIINYDILEKRLPFILEQVAAGKLDTLILDEAHYIKGKSLRAACVVGGAFKPKGGERIKFDGIAKKMRQVYCLTGTPLLNRPIELFNLLRAIGHPYGNARGVFAKRFCGAFQRQIWNKYLGRHIFITDESGASNIEELSAGIRDAFLRRKKKDVLDLPEKIVSIADCELSPEWKKRYGAAWEDYLGFLEANPIPERNIDNILMARHLVEIQKLKQVCSRSKIKRLADDVENAAEQDEKVIIFSQYTETIRQLSEELAERKIVNVTLTGADDMNERQKAVDQFQKEGSPVKAFIANIKAGGVGLNLTAATIVMFVDMDWSPEIHNQAEDRAHRIGQGEMVNVYYYICGGTIEDDIVEILKLKRETIDAILEGRKVGTAEGAQAAFLRRMAERAKS